MRILVVGAAGQVGSRVLREAVRRGHEVVGTFNARRPLHPTYPVVALDKTDPETCRAVVRAHRPDVVVDTGALHNVDYCESHPDEAARVNTEGVRHLAEAAGAVGGRLVFVSTDYVFDGSVSRPYTESDPPRPQSVYGRTKLAGEQEALRAAPHNLVVRPSVIYSWLDSRERAESSSGKGTNFGTWLARELRQGREVRVVNDQTSSPTYAPDLAGAILALVERQAGGVYHAAGATAVDRYGFARRMAERLGCDAALVRPVSTADLHQKAPRPLNSALDSSKLAATTGYRTMELDKQLDEFLKEARRDPAF